VKFPADPLRQPSIVVLSELALALLSDCGRVLGELVSGVGCCEVCGLVDGDVWSGVVLGEVLEGFCCVVDGELGCDEPGDVCATTHTDDSSRTAANKYPFLISILLLFLSIGLTIQTKWRCGIR